MSSQTKTTVLAAWIAATLLGYLAVGRPISTSTLPVKRPIGHRPDSACGAHRALRYERLHRKRRFRSVGLLYVGHKEQFPGWAGVLQHIFPDDVIAGRRVRFVESDIRIIESS
jgi:hypothetical protein